MQIWVLDSNNFFIESKLVTEEELQEIENYTDIPFLIGYVKPRFVDSKWVEGATEEEIQEWKNSQTDKTNNLSENEKLRKELLATQKMLVNLQTEVLLNQI